MDSAPARPPHLMQVAIGVALVVLLLGGSGLFNLTYSQSKWEASLRRLQAMHAAQVAAVEAQVAFKTQVQEWKNIILRGRSPADYRNYRQRFEADEVTVRENLISAREKLNYLHLESYTTTALIKQHEDLGKLYRDALDRYPLSDPVNTFVIDATLRGVDRNLAEEIDQLATSVSSVAEKELQRFSIDGSVRYARQRQITWIADSLAVVGAIWLIVIAAKAGRGSAN